MKKNRDSETKQRKNSIILLWGIVIAALLIMAVPGGSMGRQGTVAVVTVDGEECCRYTLFTEREIPIGKTNTLMIKDGKADVVWADCPDGICVRHAPIGKVGESIICLPNKVVVTIEASAMNFETAAEEMDAIVR